MSQAKRVLAARRGLIGMTARERYVADLQRNFGEAWVKELWRRHRDAYFSPQESQRHQAKLIRDDWKRKRVQMRELQLRGNRQKFSSLKE